MKITPNSPQEFFSRRISNDIPMNKTNLRFGTITLLLLIACISRFIPHPPNFAPMGAMALFGAAYYSKRWLAYLVPVITFYFSDLFLNNVVYGEYFDSFVWLYQGAYWTYGSMLLIVLVGSLLLRKISASKVIIASLTASVLFFLVSNFGVWFSTTMYPKNLTGLAACYTAGIPFFKNTLLGDFVYCGVMFGVFEFAERRIPALRLNKAFKSRKDYSIKAGRRIDEK
ncbi:MAG: hypothetical protein PHT70_01865 [Bacteroidales bacterium]|nr:hypothetical protein [Bacteroidales bacterium]MDD2831099.1 hypothetical protein [Bacteroidales bacterium]MDD3208093.1 hypothetical protein [Bacteroidales bacterium]MDD3696865.1 hypothetical protein [Bacteroidales bacterium]MDD4167166.1 hypothetical protein [Bacteroidales bacterium]